MTHKATILHSLKSKKSDISRLGVKSIGLFGSYVRSEPSENSDIDLLVDFKPEMENFDNYMAVYDLIEQLFKNHKIEMVTKNGLSPYFKSHILEEVQYV